MKYLFRSIVFTGKILVKNNVNYAVFNQLLYCTSIKLPCAVYSVTCRRSVCTGYESTKSRMVEFQNMFGWSEKETMEILKENPKLIKNRINNVKDISLHLEKIGISKQCISNSPWLLLNSLNTVKVKLKLIEEIGIDENSIHLLPISCEKLKTVIKVFSRKPLNENIPERVQYLCENLEVNVGKLYELIGQYPFLIYVDFSKVKNIMKMLKNANVSSELICKDLWIFRHNEEIMAQRMKTIQLIGAPIKTWLLRSTEKIFNNSLARWKKKVKALGKHDNIIDYLAERLNCSKEYICVLSERNPRLLTVHPLKVKEPSYLFGGGMWKWSCNYGCCQSFKQFSIIYCYRQK
ncbi:uncharacterized protein LOC111638617 isoform X2 [Centruroides sculpturatus]|uniref:uncharacterized protein LOC111638617 isoform X2 n=1 Tax=Centruroides sculpturatus TaxID=218467 RepID=UPI000C6DE968|nr:uncharacterized protein LOC111638617 isoform X2 [Centruroides sculpturatus]